MSASVQSLLDSHHHPCPHRSLQPGWIVLCADFVPRHVVGCLSFVCGMIPKPTHVALHFSAPSDETKEISPQSPVGSRGSWIS